MGKCPNLFEMASTGSASSSSILSDISVWKREKIGYNIALSQAEVWSKFI
jgi:hypothetical protein